MSTIADRIKLVRGDTSQGDFAKCVGVSKNTVGRWERGERTPDQKHLQRILDAHPDINPAWLVVGEEPMKKRVAGNLAINSQAVVQGSSIEGEVVQNMGNGQTNLHPEAPLPIREDLKELVELLENYGNPALIADIKKKLLKIKEVMEG